MFDTLAQRLSQVFRGLAGKATLTEKNIKEILAEIRGSLLDADVALTVVEGFITDLAPTLLGQSVPKELSPAQFVVKQVQERLTAFMGSTQADFAPQTHTPTIILLAGLQGSGKTTTAGKLARYLQAQKKKVALVSVDVYRPAAIAQLETVATSVNATFIPSDASQAPLVLAQRALESARQQYMDYLIIDTAGRLHIDEEMMTELQGLHQELRPQETLFVIDSMTGQDAAQTAQAFHQAVQLTGVILTKVDGDSRGGAALSVRYLTGQPIKFMGTGEKLDALVPFVPKRIASRILGMGDMLSLIEKIEATVDKKAAAKMAAKVKKGETFHLGDFKEQLQQLQSMGGLAGMMQNLPMMPGMPKGLQDEKMITRMIAIINSMTPQERRFPDLVKKGSRKNRIAKGAGVLPKDVNMLLKMHEKMQSVFKKMTGKGAGLSAMRSKLQNSPFANMLPPFS